jgi:arylsulfatase A-like enzyme
MGHTDKQLQRVVNFLKSENQYDDTIILVMSDNGAPGAGPIEGRLDVRRDAYLGGEHDLNYLCKGYMAFYSQTWSYWEAMAECLRHQIPARSFKRFLQWSLAVSRACFH